MHHKYPGEDTAPVSWRGNRGTAYEVLRAAIKGTLCATACMDAQRICSSFCVVLY